jgi:LmbE family N-acetylglucosaminyl deacetylase
MDPSTTYGTSDIERLGTVLGVWAHPDDEAFLSAGLMALARAAGNRVVVATATRGERGTADEARWPLDRLARLRSDELAASLAALGVVEHRWLGHPDGGCAAIDHSDGVEQLRRVLEDVRPDTILTFAPDGLTGHDDHRAVSAWTTAAWHALRGKPRLLYAACTASFTDQFGDLNAQYSIFPPGLPRITPLDELAVRLRLSGTALERKLAALRAHASQVAALHREVGHERFAAWWSEEAFWAAPDGAA